MAMLHLNKHIKYLQATCLLLNNSVSNRYWATEWNIDNASFQELVHEVSNLNTSVSKLQNQVSYLQSGVS